MDEARYREAERLLWEHAGVSPSEVLVDLPRIGSTVRVQSVGEGDPVLFIHGGPNAGSTWAPMVPHLSGFSCLLVDRPGTGLSEPVHVTADNIAEFGSRFIGDVLDGLGRARADVVASSFGGHLALRSAAAEPQRLGRMVQMAAPAAVPGQVFPPFMKALGFRAVRGVINALPPSRRVNAAILRQIGHGASLDSGRIPPEFMEWYLALGRHTDTMRNDGRIIGEEFLPKIESVTLTEDLLSSVSTPTLFLWGADDGFGGEHNARYVTGLLPEAELVMMPDCGHLPWLDLPVFSARATEQFLRSGSVVEMTDGPSVDTAELGVER